MLIGAVRNAALSLDATSTWELTADSQLASLAEADGVAGDTLTNIHGHGHQVHYQASLPVNHWLGGKIWNLGDGGTLAPE